MAKKQPYEELEQRVKGLQKEVVKRKQAENALRESEERYRSLIHKIQAAVVVHDADTRIIACNSKAQELLELAEDKMLGKTANDPDWKFLNADGERMSFNEYPAKQVLANRQPLRDLTVGIYRPNEIDQVWVLVNADPVFDYNGNIQQVIVTFMDITERKKMEAALRESEEKYRSLLNDVVDSSDVGIFILDSDFKVVWVNQALERYFGLRKEEIIGNDKRQLVLKQIKYQFEDPEGFAERVLATYDENTYVENFECHMLFGDNREDRWLEHWSQPIRSGLYSGGRVEIYYDISDLKQAEKELLFKENIINSSSSVISTCDLEGNMTYGNPSFLKTWGFDDPKEFLGRPFWKFWFVEDRLDEIMQMLRDKGTWFGEIQAIRKDGTLFDVQISAATVFDSEGNSVALTSTSIDVTARKRAEEELRESEERLRIAGKAAYDLNYEWNVANDSLEWFGDIDGLLGYDPGAISRDIDAWLELIHPEDRGQLENAVELHRTATEPIRYDYRIKHRDGTYRQIHDHGLPMLDKQGRPYKWIGVCADITDRKRAEDELLSEKLLSESYINSLPGLFYVFDEQRFVKWNSAWNRITGYSDEELAKRYGTDFFEGEDRTFIGEQMVKVFHEGAAEAEAELVTKDGRRIPYYFTGLRKKLNGKEHLIGLGIDITKRKRAEEEREKLQDQLLQGQKMERIATLAGGVAHEFNNALMGIIGNIELLKMDLPEDERRDKYFEAMKSSGHRMSRLTDQLLAYAQGGKYQPKNLRLDDFVRETLPILKHNLSPTVRVKTHFQKNISYIKADYAQMQMILSAILAN